MYNIMAYITFRGDLSFKQVPFNEVDAMLFSTISSVDYTEFVAGKLTIYEAALLFREKLDGDWKGKQLNKNEELFLKMGMSKRYRDIVVDDAVKTISMVDAMTFYGVTFLLDKHHAIVAFRGTADSLVSWKENFYTLYQFPTKGMSAASEYLNAVLKERRFRNVTIVGHSKGGNLSVYAAMFVDDKLKKKITNVYMFDAPGFSVDISEMPEYLSIKDKLKAYVPEVCVVGNMMTPPWPREHVANSAKSVEQHDMFNWSVGGECFELAIVDAEDTDVSNKVNAWMQAIPKEEMGGVVEELFGVFENNGIEDIHDLMNIDFKHLLGMIMSATKLSSENRTLLGIIMKELRNKK